MDSLEVVEVESRGQLRQFITFPNRLYRDDPNYVVPLLSERFEFFDQKNNPFYRTAKVKLFLAMRGSEVVGRIATCLNYRHNDFHEEKVGFFGFFDTINDYDVASRLLKVAMITLKLAGMEKMRGPMNFSTNHEIGFLVEGFDSPPVVMMTYNAPYQPKLAEQFGMKKEMDLLAGYMNKAKPISPRIKRVVDKLANRSQVTLRTIKMKNFAQEVELIRSVYNQAWEQNWGFVPMDEAEFNHMAKNLKQIVDPELVFIAEHKGQPVGFLLALPDINQALIHLKGRLLPFGILKLLWHTKVRNKIDGLRMITMGIIPQFHRRAVDSMLYIACYEAGVRRGYNWAEFSWMLETNELIIRATAEMGAEQYKRYRIYQLPL
jgi:GNAT superfamily N-acetyltransferase